jgi:hypothetical protein
MRASALLFAAVVMTTNVAAQNGATAAPASPEPAPASGAAPAQKASPPSTAASSDNDADLPVSLDRIRKALERPPLFPVQVSGSLPTFRVDVQERNRLQDILSTLDFSSGPRVAGGLYASEMQRVMFPSVSNPLRQPYAAFSQPELLTIIIENLAGRYLANKLSGAFTADDRAAAEAAARDELRRVIAEYCAGQPNQGAGIKICTDPPPELPKR